MFGTIYVEFSSLEPCTKYVCAIQVLKRKCIYCLFLEQKSIGKNEQVWYSVFELIMTEKCCKYL